jgi:hypothetical protein
MHMLWVARNSVEVATDLDPRMHTAWTEAVVASLASTTRTLGDAQALSSLKRLL